MTAAADKQGVDQRFILCGSERLMGDVGLHVISCQLENQTLMIV